MKAIARPTRREQLDAQLPDLTSILPRHSPPGGWIKSIREALGMNLEAFARRLGVASKSTAHQLEQAEVDETITVKRLRAAADALGCDLAIVMIPRIPLTQMVADRAREVVVKRMSRVGHSMVKESQALTQDQSDQIVDRAARKLVEQGDRSLWE